MLSAIAVLVAYETMLTGLRPFPLLTEILTHYSKLIFTEVVNKNWPPR